MARPSNNVQQTDKRQFRGRDFRLNPWQEKQRQIVDPRANSERANDRKLRYTYSEGEERESIFSRISGRAEELMSLEGQSKRAVQNMRKFDRKVVHRADSVQRSRSGFLKTVRALHDCAN